MSHEFEAAAADSLGSVVSGARRADPPAGAACANCDTLLEGPFCHRCGQIADNHRRSILPLAWEAVQDLFHLDGRLRRTLPDLFLRPGRLARDYLEGRIARHVPPFRMFLVSLLLFIFAAEFATHRVTMDEARRDAAAKAALASPAGRLAGAAKLRREAASELTGDLASAASDRLDDLKDPDERRAKTEARYAREVARARSDYAEEMEKAARVQAGLPERSAEMLAAEDARDRAGGWFKVGIHKAAANPEYYWSVMFTWGHRAAVLLLPIVALALALVYVRQKRFYIHDHLLVAMDLLSFSFLVWGFGFLLPPPIVFYWLGLVTIWTPLNLFQTLRGAYGSSVICAGIKTLLVWLLTQFAFGVLLMGLLVFTLSQI